MGDVASPGEATSPRAFRAPRQERSRRTLDRILDAAERLLAERSFEEITVAEIVREADSSVGAFYARFSDKESLLPALYDLRYDPDLSDDFARGLATVTREGTTLRRTARETVRQIVRLYSENRWLLRAMALHARRNPGAIDAGQRARRNALHRSVVEPFLRHRERIAHEDPERAVEVGVFMVAAACRDRILFRESPHASSLPVDEEGLEEELVRALFAYLTAEAP